MWFLEKCVTSHCARSISEISLICMKFCRYNNSTVLCKKNQFLFTCINTIYLMMQVKRKKKSTKIRKTISEDCDK